MPQIVQQGSINTTALVVPDLYVQIVPPLVANLNGVPTNRIGVVGTATWGPVGQPVIVGDMTEYQATFGALQPRTYDMGTQVATAIQQGASDFRCVRVTDGTDTASNTGLFDTTTNPSTLAVSFASIYTGSGSKNDTITLTAGSSANSYKLTFARPGMVPEVFDNLPFPTSAQATAAGLSQNLLFWQSASNVVNKGNAQRGPSQLFVMGCNGNASNVAPSAVTPNIPLVTFGTDGAANVTDTMVVGTDVAPRTGMYVLRGQGCSLGVLADVSNVAYFSTQISFGLSEGIYMMGVMPSGSTVAQSVAQKATAGADSYALKFLHGDWVSWNDPVNQLLRLVSPQGFAAGLLANLAPNQSSLNKQMFGIVGTQKTASGATSGAYTNADLTALFQASIDVICNPQPGGAYFGARLGHNSSSNASISGDNYTRMTNYIASTIAAGMGVYVGQAINNALFQNISATLNNFFSNMQGQGLIGDIGGPNAFSVKCDASNNPQRRTSLGYVQADVQVQYQGINEKFIVNLQGGTSVVLVQSTGQTITTGS
jgi:uncharacterized protein